jgi:hypothetical protein
MLVIMVYSGGAAVQCDNATEPYHPESSGSKDWARPQEEQALDPEEARDLAEGESTIECPSPLNVRKDAYDHTSSGYGARSDE